MDGEWAIDIVDVRLGGIVGSVWAARLYSIVDTRPLMCAHENVPLSMPCCVMEGTKTTGTEVFQLGFGDGDIVRASLTTREAYANCIIPRRLG